MTGTDIAPRWTKGAGGMSQWPLRRWLAVCVGLLVLVSLGAITAGVVVITQLGDVRARLVDRIDPAVQQALRLDTSLLNQETGVRGFELTGQEVFLAPYTEGIPQMRDAMGELWRLVGDQPGVRPELERVEREAESWRAQYATPTIERVRASAQVGADPNEGKRRFDQVRGSVGRLQAALDGARAQARDDLADAAQAVVIVCVVIALVLLAVFLAFTLSLRAAVAGPVVGLARQVRRVADGDYQSAIQVSGPRELSELGGDVDSMRRRILDELAAQREVNAELDSRTEDLKRSNAELEQFAYVASHDLQEPLRKVASFCQLLERRYKGQLDERADQYIGFAVDGAKRMQVLINDLLAFSRVGRHVRDHVEVSANDLVANATANLAETIEETGAVVDVGDLPTVRGETALLGAVFQNLIANAIKFHGPDAPRVRVRAERADDVWLFSVTDNGIGIEPEFAERVFVIFQRLHAKEAYPGTGIGLAMCRKIVEYHGGRIWLDQSHTEPGTRFLFTLPAVETEPTTVAATEEDQ